MIIPLFQVDAFTDKLFGGNPAAVCPLDYWLPDELMQKIAAENNLTETAFVVEESEGLRIRWFTPTVEVDLCGHATLASAYVYFFHLGHDGSELVFNSRSGPLKVKRENNLLTLNFPADNLQNAEILPVFTSLFGTGIREIWKGKTDYLVVLNSQKEIEALSPDFKFMKTIEARGIIVTAPGDSCDFVSRFFGPQCGVDEDPVTGSAHTTLTVYWASRLKKSEFTAIQLSSRKGHLQCKLLGDRVEISGEGRTFMVGEIHLPDNSI